jgi:hypothetical protein
MSPGCTAAESEIGTLVAAQIGAEQWQGSCANTRCRDSSTPADASVSAPEPTSTRGTLRPVVDEDQDAGSGVGSADADVVQAAGHAQRDGAGLIDAVDAVVGVGAGAGAGVCFGSGLVGRGGWLGRTVSGAAVRAGLRRCSTMRSPPRTRSPSSQSACFGKQTATGPGSSAYTSRTALRTKRRAVRSRTTWLPSVHDGAVKCGLGVRETFPHPDASPPRCAQLMGLASRGCLVLVLGATAERRNLLFRSDLGLPWIRTSGLPRLSRQSNSKMSWARAFNGHLADPHQFLFAHTFGRIASIDADIARHRRADRGASGPFPVEDNPGHQGPHRRRPGRSADTPGARAGGVLNQKERSQPTPVAVARCGNQHVGGGCCASSRSIP